MGRPRLRLAGVQARLVERDRARQGSGHDRRRRGPDEPRRRSRHRRREGGGARARHDRRRARVARVLSVSRRAADRARRRRGRDRATGRLAPRRGRDRRGRESRRRHGVHRTETFPSLGHRRDCRRLAARCYEGTAVTVSRFRLLARTEQAAFLALPWGLPLEEWPPEHFVEAERGIGRHVVRFVELAGAVYALKELPPRLAEREYRLLAALEREGMPA